MKPLTRGTQIAKSSRVVYADLIDYIKSIKKIKPRTEMRMRPASR